MTHLRRTVIATVSGGSLLVLGVREAQLLRTADLDTARSRARQLAATRIAAGVTLLLRPQLLTNALGLGSGRAGEQWLPRLLAIREIVLGTGALACSRRDADPWPWLMSIATIDGAEAVVLLAALRRRQVDPAGGWAFVAADLGSASAIPLHLRNKANARPRASR